MDKFSHEKLDVYQAAKDFMMIVEKVVKELPKGRSYLADQLQRAALSIPLNIAEGAGEFKKKEKARFYRMALRSGTECAAILDTGEHIGLVQADNWEKGRGLLLRIISMLTRMVRRMTDSGTGAGAGACTG